jgi:hypothetical protein
MENVMNEDSRIIVDTIRQMKLIYQQVSRFLETSDSLMRESSWDTESNTAIYGSAAVYNPTQWLPSVAMRSYKSDEFPDTKRILAIQLDKDDEPDFEPIIIGTILVKNDIGDQSFEWKDWDSYWWYREYSSQNNEGLIEKIEPQVVYPKDKRGLTAVHVFALPLISIENSESLKNKVINRLLSKI